MPIRGVRISAKILTGQCILWYLIFYFGKHLWIFALVEKMVLQSCSLKKETLNRWTTIQGYSGRAGTAIALFTASTQCSTVHYLLASFMEYLFAVMFLQRMVYSTVTPRVTSSFCLIFFSLFSHFLHIYFFFPGWPCDLYALSILLHKWWECNITFTVGLAR